MCSQDGSAACGSRLEGCPGRGHVQGKQGALKVRCRAIPLGITTGQNALRAEEKLPSNDRLIAPLQKIESLLSLCQGRQERYCSSLNCDCQSVHGICRDAGNRANAAAAKDGATEEGAPAAQKPGPGRKKAKETVESGRPITDFFSK